MNLATAARLARIIAPHDAACATRLLMLAGVPFLAACRYSLHCMRGARTAAATRASA